MQLSVMRVRWFPVIIITLIVTLILLEHLLPTAGKKTLDGVVIPQHNRQSPDKSLPNIPDAYFGSEMKAVKPTKQKKCARFPELLDLKFSNNIWQIQETSIGTLQLLNAYLDDREFGQYAVWPFSKNFFTVRIVGMLDRVNSRKQLYCRMWYDSNESVLVKGELFWIWKKEWDVIDAFQPYLISCKTPDDRIPMSVSLVENKCDYPTNNLKIYYEKMYKKWDFVVCVKGLNFPFEDKSTRLVEWLELVFLLGRKCCCRVRTDCDFGLFTGASKVHFYQFSVHPNIQKVLNYYTQKGTIEVTHLSLAGHFSNSPLIRNKFLQERKVERRLQEVIPFNDCLYKYLHKTRYIVSLDIDEVIVPKTGTWSELMVTLQERNSDLSSYLARNVYFFDQLETDLDQIPPYVHMLKHVRRAVEYSKPGDYVKGFHDTTKVVALYNHISLWCYSWLGCDNHNIDVELAQLQHYRGDCVKDLSNCDDLKQNTVLDRRLWHFKDILINQVNQTLSFLEMIDL